MISLGSGEKEEGDEAVSQGLGKGGVEDEEKCCCYKHTLDAMNANSAGVSAKKKGRAMAVDGSSGYKQSQEYLLLEIQTSW